jgi:hypothetical protein
MTLGTALALRSALALGSTLATARWTIITDGVRKVTHQGERDLALGIDVVDLHFE